MKRVMIAAAALLAGCAPPVGEARSAVEAYGFDRVNVGGYALIGCSREDVHRFKWTGRNTAGRHVAGVVCGGILKDWTVRITRVTGA